MGVGLLREIYIKTNNYINGRYFAEIIKQVMKEWNENQKLIESLWWHQYFLNIKTLVFGINKIKNLQLGSKQIKSRVIKFLLTFFLGIRLGFDISQGFLQMRNNAITLNYKLASSQNEWK